MKKQEGSSELWRSLRVGDTIRLIEIPPEFLRVGYGIHKDTMRVYRLLLARGRPLRVAYLDELGMPWVRLREKRYGQWYHHGLLFNHGGIVRVRKRTKAKSPKQSKKQ